MVNGVINLHDLLIMQDNFCSDFSQSTEDSFQQFLTLQCTIGLNIVDRAL